ncbi:hypothetical protein [Demequina phytophila]|uniref:hypothetical protein n=1 Tax=Demequina phytophila TaxID=1638981 RepID=UPI000782AB13|nr:hypothetical protein [Demequina phytophila]
MDADEAYRRYKRAMDIDDDAQDDALQALAQALGADGWEVLDSFDRRWTAELQADIDTRTLNAARWTIAARDGHLELARNLPVPELLAFRPSPEQPIGGDLDVLLRAASTKVDWRGTEEPAPARLEWWSAHQPLTEVARAFMGCALTGEPFFELDGEGYTRSHPTCRYIDALKPAVAIANRHLGGRVEWSKSAPRRIARDPLRLPQIVKRHAEFAWYLAQASMPVDKLPSQSDDFEALGAWTAHAWTSLSASQIHEGLRDTGERAFAGKPADLVLTEVVAPAMRALTQPLRVRAGMGPATPTGAARALAEAVTAADFLGIDREPIRTLVDPDLPDAEFVRLRADWVRSWAHTADNLGQRALALAAQPFFDRYSKNARKDGTVPLVKLVPKTSETLAALLFETGSTELHRYVGGNAAATAHAHAVPPAPPPTFAVPATPHTSLEEHFAALEAYGAWAGERLAALCDRPIDQGDTGSLLTHLHFMRSGFWTERKWRAAALPDWLRARIDQLWPTTTRTGAESNDTQFPLLTRATICYFQQYVATPWFTVNGPYAHPPLSDLPKYVEDFAVRQAERGVTLPRGLADLTAAAVDLLKIRDDYWDEAHRAKRSTSGGAERELRYLATRDALTAAFPQRASAKVSSRELPTTPSGLLEDAMRIAGHVGRDWLSAHARAAAEAEWRYDAFEAIERYAEVRRRYESGLTPSQAKTALRHYAARWATNDIALAGEQLGLDMRAQNARKPRA